MERKWLVVIGIIILVVVAVLIWQKSVLFAPVTNAKGDGCWIGSPDIKLTPNMVDACNKACEKFKNKTDELKCKRAVKNLDKIPSQCHAEAPCRKKWMSDEEVYPPDTCEAYKDSEGEIKIDMDCALCYDLIFECACKPENNGPISMR